MNKMIKQLVPILSVLPIFFTLHSQAEFNSYQSLSAGKATLVISETKDQNEDVLAADGDESSKQDFESDEKQLLTMTAKCGVRLSKNGILIILDDAAIKSQFPGPVHFSLGKEYSSNTAKKISLTGGVGNRTLRGTLLEKANNSMQYNDTILHPVQYFCQKLLKQSAGHQAVPFSIGNKISHSLTIDENSNSVIMSEEGRCNMTTYKTSVNCQLPTEQSLSDFINYLQTSKSDDAK
ncbi:MAG: hypothetical protein IPM97_06905 [Bdellovibrionaceae bacterium]|nr:hypothetical protein [Pseudobdellovibrionaceae bacterium]